jgi:hypothetical protein
MTSEAMRDELRAVVAKACTEQATQDDVADNLILNEFIIVAARVGWDAEGENVTQIVVVPVDGPNHRILGLLRDAEIRIEAETLDGYR